MEQNGNVVVVILRVGEKIDVSNRSAHSCGMFFLRVLKAREISVRVRCTVLRSIFTNLVVMVPLYCGLRSMEFMTLLNLSVFMYFSRHGMS